MPQQRREDGDAQVVRIQYFRLLGPTWHLSWHQESLDGVSIDASDSEGPL